MTSYVITKKECIDQPICNSRNHVFQPGDLDLWPVTLTFQPIWVVVKVNDTCEFWVCMLNNSAGRALTNRHTHTDTHTGPILYPRPLMREGISKHEIYGRVLFNESIITNYQLLWRSEKHLDIVCDLHSQKILIFIIQWINAALLSLTVSTDIF